MRPGTGPFISTAMWIDGTLYLDYQATTPLDPRIEAVMAPLWRERAGNPHSADHSVGWTAARTVEESASWFGSFIGADPDEIVFTSGATEANNLALLGLGRGVGRGDRNRILVSAIEHKCVLEATRALRDRDGFTVEHVPVDSEGVVDLGFLERTLGEDVLLVSVMAVNNEIGSIQPIEAVAELAARAGALFHCDAAQAAASVDLFRIAEHADLASFSGHKIYAPQGIGALYVRRGVQECIEPLVHGGGQQSRLRSGTVPVALCAALAEALALMQGDGSRRERETLRRRRDLFVEALQAKGWPVRINGAAHRHPGNANLCFGGFFAEEILGSLQPRLAASTGSACTSGTPERSHVLKAIGLSDRDADSSIRFSLGRWVTDEDMFVAAGMIDDVLAELSAEGLTRTA